MTSEELENSCSRLQPYFSFPERFNIEEQLIDWLGEQILTLLRTNLNHFFWICYRIDIPEEKIWEILQQGENMETAKQIAVLMIERQIEKMRFREQYRNFRESSDNHQA